MLELQTRPPHAMQQGPKIGVSYFQNKCFARFGGTHIMMDVPKSGFLIFGKKVLPFSGDKMLIFAHFRPFLPVLAETFACMSLFETFLFSE